MKKNILLTILLFASLFSFSQVDLKIKKAEEYIASYRFADAKLIYEDLCFKDKINSKDFFKEYRNAALAGIKSNDFWFALKVYEKIEKESEFSFDDLYNLFKLRHFLGQYLKLYDLLNSELIAGATGPKKDFLMLNKSEKPWEKLSKDTLGSTIEITPFNSGTGDFGPVIVPNGISFSSHRNFSGKTANYDNRSFLDQYIYNDKLKTIKPVNDILSINHDGAAYYDQKNQIWYFSKNFKNLKENELTKTGIFIYDEKTNSEVEFPFNDRTYFIAQPFLSEDGLTLYFSSDMPGGLGGSDIWKSENLNGTWEKPVNLGPTINTFENEMFPYINVNDFYFASDGHLGLGGLDVFSSRMNEGQFDNVVNLGYPLNSYGDDFAVVFKNDGLTGYYTNNRKDFKFVDNIYTFKLNNLEINIVATILENLKGRKPIPQTLVLIKDENNKVIDSLVSDDNGVINFKAKKDKKYTFYLGDDDYENHQEIFSTFDLKNLDTIKRAILLNPKTVIVNTLVKDDKSGEPLANTAVQLRNTITNKVMEFETDSIGQLRLKLPRNGNYELLLTKKGFIDKLDSIKTYTRENEAKKEVLMTKIVAGTSFKIENVFYDFGKANLRPESTKELDKLSDFLLENDNIKVELSSHTDSRGGDAANQKLSQARAQSCVNYLLTKGIKKQNIVAKGYGETKLVNRCKNNVKCSDEEHQENRRTEIKILSVL